MTRRLAAVLFALILLAGCGVNRAGLKRDMVEVFAMCGFKPAGARYSMSDRSRSGRVEFTASQAESDAMVRTLGLKPVADPSDISRLALATGASIPTGPGIDLLAVTGRPGQLRLSNGGQFELLVLCRNCSTGKTIVLVAYASG